MATDRPDPAEFLQMAQRMLREMFGDARRDGDDPWGDATRRVRESFARERSSGAPGHREPSPEEQRENLTFALATRAVEALEDLALNVAAIRQRLERTDPQPRKKRPGTAGGSPDGDDAPKD